MFKAITSGNRTQGQEIWEEIISGKKEANAMELAAVINTIYHLGKKDLCFPTLKGDSVEIIGKPEYEPYVKECMRTTILEINSDGGCQAGMAPKWIDAAGLYGKSSRTDEKDGNTELSYAGCFPAENPRYAIGLFIDIQTKKGVPETNLAEQVNKLIEWLNSR